MNSVMENVKLIKDNLPALVPMALAAMVILRALSELLLLVSRLTPTPVDDRWAAALKKGLEVAARTLAYFGVGVPKDIAIEKTVKAVQNGETPSEDLHRELKAATTPRARLDVVLARKRRAGKGSGTESPAAGQ
jgi:hypothetical protein